MTDRQEPEQPDAREEKADAFIEGLAESLRTPEHVDVTFEARVMSAVHAEARAGHQPSRRTPRMALDWWLRPRTLHVTPLAGLGTAIASMMLVWLSAWAVPSLLRDGAGPGRSIAATPATDTVHLVRFVYVDPTARAVSLVGGFNGWQKGATRLMPASSGASGAWMITIPLRSGRHEYAFVVESPSGERWAVDPFAATVRDEFETESSVILLGSAASVQQRSS